MLAPAAPAVTLRKAPVILIPQIRPLRSTRAASQPGSPAESSPSSTRYEEPGLNCIAVAYGVVASPGSRLVEPSYAVR